MAPRKRRKKIIEEKEEISLYDDYGQDETIELDGP